MAQIAGKTIYVLGAGCSQHTGAPLLRDFLVKSRLLKEQGKQLTYKDSFENIFAWIDKLRSASYYVELDLDNLEHIFSLAEMLKQIGLKEGEQHFSDLRYLVMETLDSCQIRWRKGRFWPDELYSKFLKLLKELNDQRRKQIGGVLGEFENDVIITFNYDLMLDYAMGFWQEVPEYCLLSKPTPGSNFHVLKLHGSTNWVYCHDCQNQNSSNQPQIIRPTPILGGSQLLPGSLEEGQQVPFQMVTNVLPKTPCQKCNKTGTLEPIIIPPTWSKTLTGSPIARVWESAVNEIKKASQIIVIGYSMPTTDTFFQYLLTLGLASNANLNRVVVIDKDEGEDFKKRYETVFARSLLDRGRLIFRQRVTFEMFVNNYMQTVGSQLGVGV